MSQSQTCLARLTRAALEGRERLANTRRIDRGELSIPLQVSDFCGQTSDLAVDAADASRDPGDVGSGVGRSSREGDELLVRRGLSVELALLRRGHDLGHPMLSLRITSD